MLSMEQQLLIDIKDIASIAIHCTRCGSETVVNASNEEAGVPEKCSCCREDFAALGLQTPTRTYLTALRALSKLKERITLRIVKSGAL
jgi:hypothetical protein